MNIRIGSPDCKLCKLHETTEEVCEQGYGNLKASIMVVSSRPNSSGYQKMIERELSEAGLGVGDIYFASALKCRTFEQEARKRELKACTPYLYEELELVKPKWILGFGNEPLQALTGHSGIMKWRGRAIPVKGFNAKYIGTVSPAAVKRNPRQEPSFKADLRFFANQTLGINPSIDRPPIKVITSKEKLQWLKQNLEKAELLSYDIETVGLDEFSTDGAIVSLCGTMLVNGEILLWALPLYHPQSVFRKNWTKVLKYLAGAFQEIPKLIAHNGKFDDRWLHQYGIPIHVTFDTMLAAHLLDENRVKGLKPLARIILGVPPWEIDTGSLIETPLKQVLLYNALDTWYTYQLYLVFREQIIAEPRLLRLFKLLTMPASKRLTLVERQGVWIDPEKLATAKKIAFDTRDHLDEQLMEWVPTPGQAENKGFDFPTKGKSDKPVEINFNPSNFARWWLFEYLGLPVYERGKDKEDDSLGDPSMREAVMLKLKETGHPVVELLLERSKWQKYCSTYVNNYDEIRDDNNRIHTTFKIAGTVTGRLSSGKADEEKISSRKDRGRGVNLQQVPRDPFIRGLFGAPPGYSFIEADFSQIELRLAAFLAREPTMLRLYRTGADIHRYMAARVIGCPESKVTKDQRKVVGKPTNFGFVYGMYPKKFVEQAWANQELVYTLDEATAFRTTYFAEFPKLLSWHARQKRVVHNKGYVTSPMGRRRRLPDIESEDRGVMMEAERQAINSPVQAMASDMNILSMILLANEFERLGLRVKVLGVVHDAVNFEIHNDDLATALPIIKDTMENLPLKRMFGVNLDLPIISDLQLGSHWGTAKELTNVQIYKFKRFREELTSRDKT